MYVNNCPFKKNRLLFGATVSDMVKTLFVPSVFPEMDIILIGSPLIPLLPDVPDVPLLPDVPSVPLVPLLPDVPLTPITVPPYKVRISFGFGG